VKKRSISFVFPMFNEAENIATTLSKATRLAGELADDYEIIVVDDASTDDCGHIVEETAAADGRIRLIRLARNTKFGGALAKGLLSATKEVVIYTDSDFPATEKDIGTAIDLLEGADVVSPYSTEVKDGSLKRIIMSKGYNFLVRTLFGLKMRDINAGLKVYKRDVFKGMNPLSRSPFVDAEIFVEARRRGFRIEQYGVVFQFRTKGKSLISRPSIVARTFWDMLVYRFSR
jgi:glycosyltransferase involved in cell wall biosynthesis